MLCSLFHGIESVTNRCVQVVYSSVKIDATSHNSDFPLQISLSLYRTMYDIYCSCFSIAPMHVYKVALYQAFFLSLVVTWHVLQPKYKSYCKKCLVILFQNYSLLKVSILMVIGSISPSIVNLHQPRLCSLVLDALLNLCLLI